MSQTSKMKVATTPAVESPNILWCNSQSTKLFGKNLTGVQYEDESGSLSLNQLILPQFVPIDQTGFEEKDTQKSRKRMNKLRKLINESLWTGKTDPMSDLVSLKDIIVKQPQQDGSHSTIE